MSIFSRTASDGRGRGWFIAIGIVLVGLGLIALWNAVNATVVTTIILGWLLVIGGILHVVGASLTNVGRWWRRVHVLVGVLYVLAGFGVVFDALPGAIPLLTVLGVLLVVDGIARIVGVFMDRRDDVAWMVILSLIDVVFGLWIWSGIPFSGVGIGGFVGVQLLVAGIAWFLAGSMSGSGPEAAGP
jgi:uncharacterized membrane protein HdeD (DUF308 family)